MKRLSGGIIFLILLIAGIMLALRSQFAKISTAVTKIISYKINVN